MLYLHFLQLFHIVYKIGKKQEQKQEHLYVYLNPTWAFKSLYEILELRNTWMV